MRTCLELSRRAIIVLIWLVLLLGGQSSALLYAQELTPTSTPVPPAEIPEPITVILFGTGLAALSAATALRRKKTD